MFIMEYKTLIEGVNISALGVGTWGLGGKHSADYSGDEEAIASIKTAIELGMTHIDTAEYYGGGHTEELVGKAIESYKRDDLFVTSKVYRTNLQYDDVLASIKRSLKRLHTNYIDLYLVHWPSPTVPLHETMKAIEQCVDEGYARFIGVSNFSVQLFEEAQSHLKKHQLMAIQVYYNLTRIQKTYFNGLDTSEVYRYCEKNNVMMIAWSPLEEGKLTRPGYPVLDEIAKKYEKSQAQVALNWLISHRKIITIPKASSVKHIKENSGATGWSLSEQDIRLLEESFK